MLCLPAGGGTATKTLTFYSTEIYEMAKTETRNDRRIPGDTNPNSSIEVLYIIVPNKVEQTNSYPLCLTSQSNKIKIGMNKLSIVI